MTKLYHTWLYMFEAPDDGWMWHPKHVEWTIIVWNKHLGCIKLVFSFISFTLSACSQTSVLASPDDLETWKEKWNLTLVKFIYRNL